MSLAELLPAIRALPADDRRELVRLLSDELDGRPAGAPTRAEMDRFFPPGVSFEVYTPLDCFEAAHALEQLLAAEKKDRG